MNTTSLDQVTAARIINLLRSGSNCLEGADVFSAGREPLYRAAEDLFEDVELTEGASVRWIKGAYGTGKTHSFARLIEIARRRKWIVSYVQISGKGEGVELHHFDRVLAAIFGNMVLPPSPGAPQTAGSRGWRLVLDTWVTALRAQAGAREGADLRSFMFDQAVSDSISLLRQRGDVHGSVAGALKHYATASRDNDLEWQQLLLDWFSGTDVFKLGAEVKSRFRAAGILEPITRKNAKAVLCQVSVFVRYCGFKGILILFDEVEHVLGQPPSARRSAYTVLRELIDNVDDVHGMKCALFYMAGTPDLFDSEKGILEYEALAARALPPSGNVPNPAALVVDLAQYPIGRDALLDIGRRIATIYSLARGNQDALVNDRALAELFDRMSHSNQVASVRLWVRSVVEALDVARTAAQGPAVA